MTTTPDALSAAARVHRRARDLEWIARTIRDETIRAALADGASVDDVVAWQASRPRGGGEGVSRE